MAGTAISLATTTVEGVLKILTALAADEVAKVLGVRKEVWYIRGELEMMQSFLMAAEARKNDNIVVRTWIKQVKDLAYQIEDCLAEFSFHLEKRGLYYRLRTLNTRRRIASNIRDIKAKVQEVSQRNLRYNLIKPVDVGSDATSRYINITTQMTAHIVDEKDLVGQFGPIDELINLIVENHVESRNNIELENVVKHKKVIWIIGMGGLGKTTLTKKVYDNQKIRTHFECKVWIIVSQNFDLRNILINIAMQIRHNRDVINKRDDELVDYVRSELKEKYLVVLDDLWSIRAWKTIENLFPDSEGSCVVVTTRNKDVAEHCSWKVKHIYPLKPLSNQDALDLLLRKINKSNDFLNQDEHKNLKDVIDKIIIKCEGLPLALITIGGLLVSKPINEEWEKVLMRLNSELATNPSAEAVKRILDLSYIDLPYHLKPCLLYLSIFPEDYAIKRSTLIHRWMAEGYVSEKHGMTPEEVGKEYFCELLNRSLIQPSKIGDDGIIKSCRVHDIMRELIVAKSIDENLIFVTDDNNREQGNTNFRHLVVPPDSKEVERENRPNIRSVSIFGGPIPDLLFSPHSKSKLLKVIDIRSIQNIQDDIDLPYEDIQCYDASNRNSYNQFIKHIQQFVHLKYIKIHISDETEHLKSIGKFRDLQTLELTFMLGCGRTPLNIAKLQQLRHLLVGAEISFLGGAEGVALDKGIRNLKKLQSLEYINIEISHPNVVEELAELQQLRKLGVFNVKKVHFEKLLFSISKLNRLRSLRIAIHNLEDSVWCPDSVSSPPKHLRSLRLRGRVSKLLTWIPLLSNLAKISLYGTELKEDTIVVLQKLRCLVVLRLYYDAYDGAKLMFENNSFPELRVLKLYALNNLEEVCFKEQSLPQLETIWIDDCDLKVGMTGIDYLPKLKKLAWGYQLSVGNLDVVLEQVEEHCNHPVFICI